MKTVLKLNSRNSSRKAGSLLRNLEATKPSAALNLVIDPDLIASK